MSVLVWWLPAVCALAVAWWRLRPSARAVRDKDVRRLQKVLEGGR
ncbi:MAG TPA: hypothetical protein PLT68_11715 [Actinomycetota bacterium]|nr:hypothetical protein [Actinomycetota bacterium]